MNIGVMNYLTKEALEGGYSGKKKE